MGTHNTLKQFPSLKVTSACNKQK